MESYDGKDNPLFHVSEHRMKFFCEFNGISHYPFVKDMCSFYFYFDGQGSAMELTIVKSSIEAQVNKNVGQYIVTK